MPPWHGLLRPRSLWRRRPPGLPRPVQPAPAPPCMRRAPPQPPAAQPGWATHLHCIAATPVLHRSRADNVARSSQPQGQVPDESTPWLRIRSQQVLHEEHAMALCMLPLCRSQLLYLCNAEGALQGLQLPMRGGLVLGKPLSRGHALLPLLLQLHAQLHAHGISQSAMVRLHRYALPMHACSWRNDIG